MDSNEGVTRTRVPAVIRCWPDGVIVQSLTMEFDAPPMVGDVIELAAWVRLVVDRRRFTTDGQLQLVCQLTEDTTLDQYRDVVHAHPGRTSLA